MCLRSELDGCGVYRKSLSNRDELDDSRNINT